jgi:hypothetical protein
MRAAAPSSRPVAASRRATVSVAAAAPKQLKGQVAFLMLNGVKVRGVEGSGRSARLGLGRWRGLRECVARGDSQRDGWRTAIMHGARVPRALRLAWPRAVRATAGRGWPACVGGCAPCPFWRGKDHIMRFARHMRHSPCTQVFRASDGASVELNKQWGPEDKAVLVLGRSMA